MNNTRNEILRLGENFIRTKGYNAFSYADIAEIVNIRKATIHYYFPSKADLGAEIIRTVIKNVQAKISEWADEPCEVLLRNWVSIFSDGNKQGRVCILGALCPVFETLPPKMQIELKKLSDHILEWLENLLSKGRDNGIFHFNGTTKSKAYLIQSTLIASLLLNKVCSYNIYDDIVEELLK